MGDSIVRALIVIAIIAILMLVGIGIVQMVAHGGCAEWRDSGTVTCTGDHRHTTCYPVRQCVRYNDGETP